MQSFSFSSSSSTLDQNNLLTFFWLTVGMLIGQPVVFGILKLKVGVAELALLRSEVFKMPRAVVCVAELILVVYSRAVLATIGRPGERNNVSIRGADQTVCETLEAGQNNTAHGVRMKYHETHTSRKKLS